MQNTIKGTKIFLYFLRSHFFVEIEAQSQTSKLKPS